MPTHFSERLVALRKAKGMTPEDIEKLLGGEWKYEEKKGDSNGLGMDNVCARLKLFCGREDVIEIKSEGVGSGTEVIINIPYDTDQE